MSDFDTLTAQFEAWLKLKNIVLSDKVRLHDYRTSNQGRGMIALADIEADETLFTIPKSQVFCVDNSSDKEFLDLAHDLDPWLVLISYMICRENDPEWTPYFSLFPTASDFGTPMFWSSDELKFLQGSAVVDKIGREQAEAAYNDQVKPLVDQYSKTHPDMAITNTVENFHRMGSIIMAYSFDIIKSDTKSSDSEDEDDEVETVKALVPPADMLNAHTKLCNSHLYDEPGAENLEMRAIHAIKKGEQVYNTYGELPNSDLLRRYGYVQVGGTQFDVAEIPTQLFVDAIKSEISQDRLKRLAEVVQQLQDSDEDIYDDSFEINATGEPDPELMAIVGTIYAAAKHPDVPIELILKRLLRHGENGAMLDSIATVWKRAIDERLKAYPQDLVSQAISAPNVSNDDAAIFTDRSAMAREVLLGEIRALTRSIDWSSGSTTVPESSVLVMKRKR